VVETREHRAAGEEAGMASVLQRSRAPESSFAPADSCLRLSIATLTPRRIRVSSRAMMVARGLRPKA